AISADGRLVAYSSFSDNLVPGDMNGFGDIFVYNRQTGQLRRVSVGPGGSEENGSALTAALSLDGRMVGFRTDATNLVPGDTPTLDVYVVDTRVVQAVTAITINPPPSNTAPVANPA